MNIAFHTFLIFLFLLPGFIFYLTFHNIENTYLNYEPLARKTIISIFVAILLHTFSLPILFYSTKYKINPELLLSLVSGVQDTDYSLAVKSIGVNLLSVFIYIILICITAFILAKILRWIIKKSGLDKFNTFFRPENPWYYLFKGYDWEDGEPDGVVIAATLELAGKGYLYIGVLEDFFLDENGNIDRLILIDTARRSIEKDKAKASKENNSIEDERFYPIDGDYFVIKYTDIKTLNVQFFRVEKLNS